MPNISTILAQSRNPYSAQDNNKNSDVIFSSLETEYKGEELLVGDLDPPIPVGIVCLEGVGQGLENKKRSKIGSGLVSSLQCSLPDIDLTPGRRYSLIDPPVSQHNTG